MKAVSFKKTMPIPCDDKLAAWMIKNNYAEGLDKEQLMALFEIHRKNNKGMPKYVPPSEKETKILRNFHRHFYTP